MQPKSVNLNQVVADHLQSSPRIIKENVRVEFMSDEGLGNVYADPSHLRKILTNLFVNANNSMPDGGELILLTRNVRRDAPPSNPDSMSESDNYVMLSVTDTGSGMDDSTINGIFEPWSANGDDKKSVAPCLSVIHGIISKYNGGMKVRSKVGEGTTFQLYFPSGEETA